MAGSANNFKDISNQRFHRLLVLRFSHKTKTNMMYWLCKCDCGKEKTIASSCLKAGTTKSCGCFRSEYMARSKLLHGLSKTTEYRSWVEMIKRCTDRKNHAYSDYGGRGITVCERWLKIENFLTDMGKKPESHYSIERIDNNGVYEPSNCKWATPKEQSCNRRSNIYLTHNGEELTISQWESKLGFNKDVVRKRLRRGWSIGKALTTPSISCA
jgi:hypothetical protein